MGHVWSTSDGRWYIDGRLAGVGHSGRAWGKNKPFDPDARMPDRADLTQVRNLGVMPAGWYKLGPVFQHARLGPLTIAITPEPGTQTFGRSGFFCHGAGSDPDQDSKGCPVLGHFEREGIAAAVAAGNKRLQVVERYQPEVT